jgi:hypothetical protein
VRFFTNCPAIPIVVSQNKFSPSTTDRPLAKNLEFGAVAERPYQRRELVRASDPTEQNCSSAAVSVGIAIKAPVDISHS